MNENANIEACGKNYDTPCFWSLFFLCQSSPLTIQTFISHALSYTHPPFESIQRFFRLLAGASLTQVAFWTSYAFLPAELSGSMGYWGIFGSGAFVLIARHFAMVREVDMCVCVGLKDGGEVGWPQHVLVQHMCSDPALSRTTCRRSPCPIDESAASCMLALSPQDNSLIRLPSSPSITALRVGDGSNFARHIPNLCAHFLGQQGTRAHRANRDNQVSTHIAVRSQLLLVIVKSLPGAGTLTCVSLYQTCSRIPETCSSNFQI